MKGASSPLTQHEAFGEMTETSPNSVNLVRGQVFTRPKINPAFAPFVEIEDLNTETLQSVASEIGIEATFKLVNLFGGSRLYVAMNPGPDDEIWQIGAEAASILVKMYAPSRLDLPLSALSAKALRRLARTRVRAGVSHGIVATDLGVSYRSVERWAGHLLTHEERNRLRRDSDGGLTRVRKVFQGHLPDVTKTPPADAPVGSDPTQFTQE